jgi:hypothetical protein
MFTLTCCVHKHTCVVLGTPIAGRGGSPLAGTNPKPAATTGEATEGHRAPEGQEPYALLALPQEESAPPQGSARLSTLAMAKGTTTPCDGPGPYSALPLTNVHAVQSESEPTLPLARDQSAPPEPYSLLAVGNGQSSVLGGSEPYAALPLAKDETSAPPEPYAFLEMTKGKRPPSGSESKRKQTSVV